MKFSISFFFFFNNKSVFLARGRKPPAEPESLIPFWGVCLSRAGTQRPVFCVFAAQFLVGD